MSVRRLAAGGSLTLALATVVIAVALAIDRFPHGILVLACLWVVLFGAWHALRSRGGKRLVLAALAALAAVLCVVAIVREGEPLANLLVVAAFLAAVALARLAFTTEVTLPPAPRPARPVLFFNPRSGGGKAVKFNLSAEAGARGISAIELSPGTDLRDLVSDAIDTGADALAMAGGDGSQAIVAEFAAANDLPYACIPAGTRNHFALDLGVDRDDVVGALDALVSGGERRVDLAEVNGQVFVNNVSLGLYADAVQLPGYREAKIRTLLELAPAELGADGATATIRWNGEHEEEAAIALLVSNDPYRLGVGLGAGTRPRLDEGVLGIAALAADGAGAAAPVTASLRQWRAREFELNGDDPVPAGIDGEATVLAAPVRFRSRPGVLRVRIAPGHPGASPSAAVPAGLGETISELFGIARGGDRFTTKSMQQEE